MSNEVEVFNEKPPESTYVDSTYRFGGQDPRVGQAVERGAQEANDELSSLAAKLGINPEALNQQAEPQQEQEQEQTPEESKEDFLAKFQGERAAKVLQEFKEISGIDVVEAYQMVQDTSHLLQGLESWRKEVVHERQISQLQQEWGANFDQIMPKVLERFVQLRETNPKLAQSLDSIDGAKLLAAQVQLESYNSAPLQRDFSAVPPKQQFVPRNAVPQYRGRPQTPTIRMSDFMTWTDAEVQSRMGEIRSAKAAGTFINDL